MMLRTQAGICTSSRKCSCLQCDPFDRGLRCCGFWSRYWIIRVQNTSSLQANRGLRSYLPLRVKGAMMLAHHYVSPWLTARIRPHISPPIGTVSSQKRWIMNKMLPYRIVRHQFDEITVQDPGRWNHEELCKNWLSAFPQNFQEIIHFLPLFSFDTCFVAWALSLLLGSVAF